MRGKGVPILRDSTVVRYGLAWPLAFLAGAIVGVLLGWTITGWTAGTPPPPTGDPDTEKVPVIRVGKTGGSLLAVVAGLAIGAFTSSRTRPKSPTLALSSAMLSGMIATVAAVLTLILLQWHRGRWAVGTMDGRTFFVAGALFVLICTTSIITAMMIYSGRARAQPPDAVEQSSR
jgi:hypothetical protein